MSNPSDRLVPPVSGVLPVMQTPYLENEDIDFETLDGEIDWLFDRGANGIVMAMVSEVLRLSSEERDRMAERVCRRARGRGHVVISVGAESSHLAERYARSAEAYGATAVMAIPPVSVSLGEAELRNYYERILRAVSLPVIIQDASGYVGQPIAIDLEAKLFREYGSDRVWYKPEANPIGPRLTALRQATSRESRVFEGSGGVALVDSYRRGIVGTMPGADLIDAIVALWRALEAGDDHRTYSISLPLSALVALQSSLDAFLAGEKYLLVKQGVFKSTIVRGPRGFVLDAATRSEVDRLFDLLTHAVETR